jgi:hypothetical protein
MKATTYLVWKNPNCNGNNPEWMQISGREFYALVNTSAGKKRHFIKLRKASENDVDIVLEATATEYVNWRKEKDHADYLAECEAESGYQTLSYVFSDTRKMLSFIEEAKKQMPLWIQADRRVKSYEILRRCEYMGYQNESEEKSDET